MRWFSSDDYSFYSISKSYNVSLTVKCLLVDFVFIANNCKDRVENRSSYVGNLHCNSQLAKTCYWREMKHYVPLDLIEIGHYLNSNICVHFFPLWSWAKGILLLRWHSQKMLEMIFCCKVGCLDGISGLHYKVLWRVWHGQVNSLLGSPKINSFSAWGT